MAEDAIPADVRSFIAAHIDSVLQLEILLLLCAQPARQWSADDVAGELRINAAWATGQMTQLVGAGVLSSVPGPPIKYQYQPRSVELHNTVLGLSRAYADRRVTVIGLIFSKPLDKIRSFADAFKFRKE